MQDANYAHTSGYAAANALDDSNSYDNIQTDGRMGWSAADMWAAQLEFGGYDDWRLPLSDGTTYPSGINKTSGELGHMFYNNLYNTAYHTILNNVSFYDATAGGGIESFLNVQSYVYWLGEGVFSAFGTNNGVQYGLPVGDYDSYFAWAVRDGDVSTVPVPAAAWLFGSALAGLLVARRKNKK